MLAALAVNPRWTIKCPTPSAGKKVARPGPNPSPLAFRTYTYTLLHSSLSRHMRLWQTYVQYEHGSYEYNNTYTIADKKVYKGKFWFYGITYLLSKSRSRVRGGEVMDTKIVHVVYEGWRGEADWDADTRKKGRKGNIRQYVIHVYVRYDNNGWIDNTYVQSMMRQYKLLRKWQRKKRNNHTYRASTLPPELLSHSVDF